MSVRVPLRHYRFFSRQPYIELDGPAMQLRLPGIFGGRKVWNLNVADVAVVCTEPSSSDDTGDDWVFEEPVIIPFAATTSQNVNPNLELLFKTPQRIPSLRVFGAQTIGLSYFQSRSAAGVQIDGLDLRAEDPVAAVATLAAAGMERVDRTGAWLRRHRRVTQDPALMKVAKTNDQRQRWVTAIVMVAFILMIGAEILWRRYPGQLGVWRRGPGLAGGLRSSRLGSAQRCPPPGCRATAQVRTRCLGQGLGRS